VGTALSADWMPPSRGGQRSAFPMAKSIAPELDIRRVTIGLLGSGPETALWEAKGGSGRIVTHSETIAAPYDYSCRGNMKCKARSLGQS